MTYAETLNYLYTAMPSFQEVGAAAYKPGLERITALCEALETPQRRFRSIHVAGTNGKGSVSHLLASVLQAAGYRVGLFTSPHLWDFRERIRINGEVISQEEVVDFVAQHRSTFDTLSPSFFELTTAMAFDHFARHEVDVAVVETGMGGRLDSTNILSPLLSIITNISLDHTQFLGESIAEIAAEKGGIIKADTPVVVGESALESQLTLIQIAKSLAAPIRFADQGYRTLHAWSEAGVQHLTLVSTFDGEQITLTTDLLGAYQRHNLPTLLAALDVLAEQGIALDEAVVRAGIATVVRSTGLRGRWEVLGSAPLRVCDTAHNPSGVREVMAQLACQRYKRLYMVVGFAADKALDPILSLLPTEAHYLFTQASGDRALAAEELAQQATKAGLTGEVIASVEEAYARACSLATEADMIFVGGSNFVVAELPEGSIG